MAQYFTNPASQKPLVYRASESAHWLSPRMVKLALEASERDVPGYFMAVPLSDVLPSNSSKIKPIIYSYRGLKIYETDSPAGEHDPSRLLILCAPKIPFLSYELGKNLSPEQAEWLREVLLRDRLDLPIPTVKGVVEGRPALTTTLGSWESRKIARTVKHRLLMEAKKGCSP
jgi:hypothetical protein